jgi:lipopolysaccharide biosynthesis regulator YciM
MVDSMNGRKLAAASSRIADKNVKQVLRALKEARHGRTNTKDPIVEQLRKCPEAFKVGKILGKAFDSLKYAQHEGELGGRYLPPAGTVIPPLV